MKLTLFLLAGMGGLLLISKPPAASCPVAVEQVGVSFLQQISVQVTVSPTCPLDGKAVIRYRTPFGGVLPPIGYIVLRGSFPRNTGFWLRPGSVVEQKINGTFYVIWRVSE